MEQHFEEQESATIIRLDASDEHVFYDFNRFETLEKVSSASSASTSSSISSQKEKPDILDLIERYESLNTESMATANSDVSVTSIKIEKKQQAHVESLLLDPDQKPVNFRQINRDLKAFVRGNDNVEVLIVEPLLLPPIARRFVHELAAFYQLATHSFIPNGSNDSAAGEDDAFKSVRVERVRGRTRMPGDFRKVDHLLAQAEKAISYYNRKASTPPSKHTGKPVRRDWKCKSKRDKVLGEDEKQVKPATKPKEGEVVGGDAKPIGSDNVGMQMLLKMGWTVGAVLGQEQQQPKSQQDASPIQTVFRSKRRGLQ